MHAASHYGARGVVGPVDPLARYPLIATSDIDEAEVRGASLLSRYRLGVRRKPSFDATVNGCSLGGVDLYFVRFGATEVDVASEALDDRFGIVIPLFGKMTVRYKSSEFDVVTGSSAAIISPGDEFRMTWSDSFSSLTLRVPQTSLLALARSVLPGVEADYLTFDPLVNRPAALRSICGAAEVLCESIARVGSAERVPPLLAARVREQFATALLTMQPNNLTYQLYQPSERITQRAVREAVDLVEAEAANIWTVAELARRVGVTTRALQIGFQRELNTTPATYMHDTRMARAHAEILAAQPGEGVTVGDVALRWGFQHAGRFAVYYRRRFGESPSEVLRRSLR